MYQKFIINEGRLKTGLVDQHRELALDHSTTRGGGWWYMDKENYKIWLYGKSVAFGSVSLKVLQQVIKTGCHDYPDFTFYFSGAEKLADAMQKAERLE